MQLQDRYEACKAQDEGQYSDGWWERFNTFGEHALCNLVPSLGSRVVTHDTEAQRAIRNGTWKPPL